MINTALCILLFAVGHLIRDGLPGTGSTHLARAIGAFFCMAGASAVLAPVPAVLVGLAVVAGFYFDRKHGEGQNARSAADTEFLMLSGLTSVAPLVLLVPWAVLAGVAKPPVWIAAWKVVPERRWLSPTRAAATVFGALIGAAVALVPVLVPLLARVLAR
jgi:hypothetical protein